MDRRRDMDAQEEVRGLGGRGRAMDAHEDVRGKRRWEMIKGWARKERHRCTGGEGEEGTRCAGEEEGHGCARGGEGGGHGRAVDRRRWTGGSRGRQGVRAGQGP